MARTRHAEPTDPLASAPSTREQRHAGALMFAEDVATPSPRAGTCVESERDAELGKLKRHIVRFLNAARERHAGRGGPPEFQAADFSRYLSNQGIEFAHLDMGTSGGLWNALKGRGVIRVDRHEPDGGNPDANHNSSVRPVYQLVDLAAVPEEWTR